MNVVREINKINEAELALGTSASWHDEYKDSAYIFVGGLNSELTEGDVITIFSQYGEIMNINMPREKETGKTRGFAFLMYEDQRSTILAVDNLNGAKVLERTLRVDHVKNYKQRRKKNEETGQWEDLEEEEFNAKPEMIQDQGDTSSSEDEGDGLPPIDPEDPMYEYLAEQRRESKLQAKEARKSGQSKKSKSKRKERKNETPEERAIRKAQKRAKKRQREEGRYDRSDRKKSSAMEGVEALLKGIRDPGHRRSSRSRSPDSRRHSQTPPLRRDHYNEPRR